MKQALRYLFIKISGARWNGFFSDPVAISQNVSGGLESTNLNQSATDTQAISQSVYGELT